MDSPPFIVPTNEEFLENLGIEPTADQDGEFVRSIGVTSASGECIDFSYDEIAQSISLRVSRESRVVIDIFHEGARRIRIEHGEYSLSFKIEFTTESTKSSMEIQIDPYFYLEERNFLS